MVKKESEKMTGQTDFYLSVLNELKIDTNLSRIREKLNISKENLNYYLRCLKKEGFIIQKGRGWYEVVKSSEKMTNHSKHLRADMIRGHAYVWTLKLPKEIEGWKDRIRLLDNKGINYTLVGALKTTPRIKALGRKVWLCNSHLRIYDREKASYYGNNALESRKNALATLLEIIRALENKLGFNFKPLDFEFEKEHYALIKNELAKETNKKGEIMRISDESGEWLLIDDSLGEGGELENIGKKAFEINPKMQKWWNDNKKHNFEVTPTKTLEMINEVTQNQLMFAQNIESHVKAIQELGQATRELREEFKEWRKNNGYSRE